MTKNIFFPTTGNLKCPYLDIVEQFELEVNRLRLSINQNMVSYTNKDNFAECELYKVDDFSIKGGVLVNDNYPILVVIKKQEGSLYLGEIVLDGHENQIDLKAELPFDEQAIITNLVVSPDSNLIAFDVDISNQSKEVYVYDRQLKEIKMVHEMEVEGVALNASSIVAIYWTGVSRLDISEYRRSHNDENGVYILYPYDLDSLGLSLR